MKARRVCLICGDFFPDPIGGQGIYTYELAHNLARNGYDVSVIATRRSHAGGEEFKLLPVRSSNLGLFAVEAWLRYRKLLRTFDVIHGNDFYHLCFLLDGTRRATSITTIHNTHLQRFRASRSRLRWLFCVPMALEKWACKRSDRVIAVSDTTKKALSEYGLPEKDVQVIYNGVDTNKFNPAKKGHFRRQLGIRASDKVILFVGRLVQRKRPMHVLVAVERLLALDSSYHLVIVGRGPLAQELEQYIAGHRLAENVHMLGFVDNAQLPEVYADADLFVLISVGEGLPISALEALASGCRLVLTYDASGGALPLRKAEQVLEYDPKAHKLEGRMLEALALPSGASAGESISIETCVKEVVALYDDSRSDSP